MCPAQLDWAKAQIWDFIACVLHGNFTKSRHEIETPCFPHVSNLLVSRRGHSHFPLPLKCNGIEARKSKSIHERYFGTLGGKTNLAGETKKNMTIRRKFKSLKKRRLSRSSKPFYIIYWKKSVYSSKSFLFSSWIKNLLIYICTAALCLHYRRHPFFFRK